MKSILPLFLLTVTFSGYAQNPYENVTTVSADGITFDVELSKGTFFMRNSSNTRSQRPNLYYLDGRELETLDEYAMIDADYPSHQEVRAIRESFGDSVIQSLRIYNYCPLEIFYVVGPDGTTLEVSFIMNSVPELVGLAPEVFATLDRKLKQYVKWNVKEFGRKLKYFHGCNAVNFNKVPITSELHTIKPTDSLLIIDRFR